MCLSPHQVLLELMVLWGKGDKVINSGVVQRWLVYQDFFHSWSWNEWMYLEPFTNGVGMVPFSYWSGDVILNQAGS